MIHMTAMNYNKVTYKPDNFGQRYINIPKYFFEGFEEGSIPYNYDELMVDLTSGKLRHYDSPKYRSQIFKAPEKIFTDELPLIQTWILLSLFYILDKKDAINIITRQQILEACIKQFNRIEDRLDFERDFDLNLGDLECLGWIEENEEEKVMLKYV